MQAVEDDGVLMVTCTDMATLCGNAPEACLARYGTVGLRTPACHELALRIMLQCIDAHANRYSRYIRPLVCVSVDFYIRLFVRVKTGAQTAKSNSL